MTEDKGLLVRILEAAAPFVAASGTDADSTWPIVRVYPERDRVDVAWHGQADGAARIWRATSAGLLGPLAELFLTTGLGKMAEPLRVKTLGVVATEAAEIVVLIDPRAFVVGASLVPLDETSDAPAVTLFALRCEGPAH